MNLDEMSASDRKQRPIALGVLDYFPDAIAEVAYVSYVGNEQHHPGTPVHWDKAKSSDEDDAAMRHFVRRNEIDKDGVSHRAKFVWRALAGLQRALEAEKQKKEAKMWPDRVEIMNRIFEEELNERGT